MKYTNSHVVIPGLTGNLLSIWKVLPLAAVVVLLAACGDDPKVGGTEEDAGIIAIENKTVSGVSQKGPFVNGSSVTVYGLDGETLAQTGNIYEGKIRSDMGDFSVKVVKLASQYALLKANGFYRNEVTGEKSNSQMTLYALTDLSDRDEVNVNLLTHLAYERSLYLATNSISVANAKKQAEAEVFKSFEIEGDFDAAEDMNIFGENDQSAALLAISVLMQGDLKEADFSERLDNYARDIETDGVWDDKNTATAIADWASEKSLSGGLASVRANVEKWGQLFGVPPFEKYVNNFWWQNYGLGTCDKKSQGEVKVNDNALSVKNGVHFICDNDAWRLAKDIEKDTATWGAGKFDGEVRAGQVNKNTYYIYETSKKAWREATTIEKDTYDHTNNKDWADGTDGEMKKGSITNTTYVFDTDIWRVAEEIEKELGGCIATKRGSVTEVNALNKYYCTANGWVNLMGDWSWDVPKEARLNPKITYELMKDSRDDKTYRIVKIGSQTWMAENLNYADSTQTPSLKGKSWCYENDPKNCEVTGRYYTWGAAIDSVKLQNCGYGKTCTLPDTVQGICPDGWHLPSKDEWNALLATLDGSSNPYRVILSSQSGWSISQGDDDVGFSALPAGHRTEDHFFVNIGCFAMFWSASENGASSAYGVYLECDHNSTDIYDFSKGSGNSVRCVKDEK